MAFTALKYSASANILSVILNNKELSRIEFPITTGVSVLNFDIIDEIQHTMSASVTKNPVEDGSDITDHVKVENKKATFNIVISDTPLVGLADVSNVYGRISVIASKVRKISEQLTTLGGGAIVKKVAGISGSAVDGSFIRSQDTFDLLEKLHNEKMKNLFIQNRETL